MTGTLFIIAAPSGAGKTTLVRKLCETVPKLKVSVSCTTRAPRPGEVDGVDYHFINDRQFADLVRENAFLEHEEVFDYRYGTPKRWVGEQLAAGNDIILEIDWQGARDVRAMLPEQVLSIFILPPAISALEQRLRSRGQDDDATIRRRMRDALTELSHFGEFDHLVINENMDTALTELRRIIEARRRGERYSGPDLRKFAESLMTEGRKIQ